MSKSFHTVSVLLMTYFSAMRRPGVKKSSGNQRVFGNE
jgi:hypothetical protein